MFTTAGFFKSALEECADIQMKRETRFMQIGEYKTVEMTDSEKLTARTKSWRINSNSKFAYYAKPSTDTARTSMPKIVAKEYLKELGWTWIPTMFIGLGCKVHLRKDELPAGRLLVHVSKHITAVIDGVLHDAYDCSREGTRCVYGYWKK